LKFRRIKNSFSTFAIILKIYKQVKVKNMKYRFLFLLVFPSLLFPQNLQLHYDFRHSLDPQKNAKNFPTIYFEYFKGDDEGSFLLKIQSDLLGERDNLGKFYMQVSQSFKFWEPKIYLHIEYSGGLGIAEPGRFGYYISNAFSIGSAYPFQWENVFFSVSVSYAYNALKTPSHDILSSFYWWRGFWNYKFEFAGDFDLYTLNNNTGEVFTSNLSGKKISFYGEPQFWFNLNKNFSFGSKVNLYYHVLTNENIFQLYPTLAIKYKL
jgi:Domain of unknown function (DUF5020)